MSSKTEVEWDTEYQPVVPPFDESFAVVKGCHYRGHDRIRDQRVQVHYFNLEASDQ